MAHSKITPRRKPRSVDDDDVCVRVCVWWFHFIGWSCVFSMWFEMRLRIANSIALSLEFYGVLESL
jgi:hypothetical protein